MLSQLKVDPAAHESFKGVILLFRPEGYGQPLTAKPLKPANCPLPKRSGFTCIYLLTMPSFYITKRAARVQRSPKIINVALSFA